MFFIIDQEQEIEIVHSNDSDKTESSLSSGSQIVAPSISSDMSTMKHFPLSSTGTSSTASSSVSSTVEKVKASFYKRKTSDGTRSMGFRSSHGVHGEGGKRGSHGHQNKIFSTARSPEKGVDVGGHAHSHKSAKNSPDSRAKKSNKDIQSNSEDGILDENSVTSEEENNNIELSRRLVEYFVVVSSVPRILYKKPDPPDGEDESRTFAGDEHSEGNSRHIKQCKKKGKEPGGSDHEEPDAYGLKGQQLLRPRLSRCKTEQTSNTHASKHLQRPRPPQRDFSVDRMNPRTYARIERRRVHLQGDWGASAGPVGGSAAAAMDLAAEEPNEVESTTDTETNSNSHSALAIVPPKDVISPSGMSFRHSPRFGFDKPKGSAKGHSETASSSLAGDDNSCVLPPSPVDSPPVSTCGDSVVTDNTPQRAKTPNYLLRTMNERSKKMGLSSGGFEQFEKGFQQFEKKLAKDTVEGLQSLEKKLKSMKFLRPSPSAPALRAERSQHYDHVDENLSVSSCSTFSNEDASSKKQQFSFGDTIGASAFRPSKTPTSARTPFTSQTPPSPHSSSFPDFVDPDIIANSNGGATENIRMGHDYEFRYREYNDDIDDCILEPVVTAQYPPVDHPDQPLNPMLPHFCYPQGIEYIVPSHEYKMPTVHHFVLTDSKGGKLYGTCLTVYEEFSPYSSSHDVLDDNISLPSMRDEDQERGHVELSIDGSPKLVRPRRRPKNHTYYAPRVLCMLSTWPYLTAFRTYLTQLYRLATTTTIMTAPLERYILNICSEVPAPPPGSFEVRLSILGTSIRFWAPPADQPIPYVSLPYGVLFECLDIGNVLFAWYTLACERKILLVSGQLSLLTVCAEILCSMLFPMRWTHLYIPVLPRMLTPMLDAPMPYLCGISRDNFPYAIGEISDETVVVDLDRNIITMGPQTPDLPILPQRRKMKLEAALEKYAGDVFWEARGLTKAQVEEVRESGDENELAKLLGTADAVWDEKICMMDEAFDLAYAPDSMSIVRDPDGGSLEKQSRWDAVQEAFLRFYVAMLKDYRKYLPEDAFGRRSSWRGHDSNEGGRFLVEEFLQAQRPDFQPFLEELVGTQQFDDFITKRIYNAGKAPDVTFFDQSIDAKLNRYKLKLKKVETPFLHSASAHRDLKQIDAIEPNTENVPPHLSKKGTYTYPTWPESFDETLYGKPRPIPKIITAEFDRRKGLSAMLTAKRGIAAEERHSGGSNPSAETTTFVLFFITFSQIIGRELTALEEEAYVMGGNLIDEEDEYGSPGTTASIHRTNSSASDGPWQPKINPPWMAGENFKSIHSSFRPDEKVENDSSNVDTLNGFKCQNVCEDCYLGKAIDPSTFIGIPWYPSIGTSSNVGDQEELHSKPKFESPVSDEEGIELEKARAVARAQVDLGFNTLKLMHMRKLPPEPIAYKTLIEACGRCGISHRASQLMEMMSLDGLAADSEMYFCFVKAFSKADREAASTFHHPDSCSEAPSLSRSEVGVEASRHSVDESLSGMSTIQNDVMKSVNGFYKELSATVTSNKRTFKMSKMKHMTGFFKKGLTKRKNLLVTNAIQAQLDLGHCVLEDLYPGIQIDTESDACPKCSCVLGQDNIILGWKPCDVKDYSTTCPSCKHRFVPKFSVSCNLDTFQGSQGKGSPLYLDYLSPWVLLRAIKNLVMPAASASGKAAKILGVDKSILKNVQGGIDKIIDPNFRDGTGINATLWWNMIVTFIRFKIPFTFLLQGSFQNELIVPTLDDM